MASPLSNAALQEQVSKFLDEYLINFNKGDLAAASAFYHEPTLLISATSVALISGPKDFEQYLVTTVDRLRKDNFDHTIWVGPKTIIVLDEKGLVLACCNGSRLRKDGTSIEDFTVTYSLRKDDDKGWEIVAVHVHATGTPLQRDSVT